MEGLVQLPDQGLMDRLAKNEIIGFARLQSEEPGTRPLPLGRSYNAIAER